MKRGLTHAEAIEYVGIKRRTFDEEWRPRLVGMRQGSCVIFDREDLDRLFDEFKRLAAGDEPAANDADDLPHNGPRNGRPTREKGVSIWAKKRGGFIPKTTALGKSISGSGVSDFESAASEISRKRSAG